MILKKLFALSERAPKLQIMVYFKDFSSEGVQPWRDQHLTVIFEAYQTNIKQQIIVWNQ